MRTKLLRSPRDLVRAIALAALILVLSPLWLLQTVVSLLRTRRTRGAVGAIERIDIADADLDEVLRGSSPVVITGIVDALGLDTVPDVAGLRRLAESAEVAPFTVKHHRDTAPFFLYRGDYGAELVGRSEMDLAEFCDHMFESGPADGTCTYRLFGVRDLSGRVAALVDEIAERLADRTSVVPDPAASGLWVGSKGVVTPLHHDAWIGLLFQFHGAKRVRMFAPSDRPNLAFSAPWSPRAVWSRLPARSSDTDPTEFPRFAHATPYDTELAAGEALFIPPFWSHEIEALEANISMPFRFKAGLRQYVDPGFLVPAFEIFDAKFSAPRDLVK